LKDVIVIGGPNGAGKTTMANELLPNKLGLLEFVNADSIALGLSPFDPDGAAASAGRIMLGRMNELARSARSFALETTCAGRGHARFLRQCQNDGWRFTLIFLWLNDPDRAIRRVAQRVAEGGHNIPQDVIVRRYWAGLRNLIGLYLPLADTAQIYDNSDGMGIPIANKTREAGLVIDDRLRWAHLNGAVNEGLDRS
jgi:predicted ABC-type ATPase